MKIRALEIAHWGCIGSLRLPELPDGIVVLHGPNGIGKSSLVQALRSCLFDHDHNSQHERIQCAVNWRSKAVPRVVVDFERKGRRWRATKAFSKLKDGEAKLEELADAGWTELVRGKEANRQVREVAGVDKSDAGLFQLLWLTQGDVELPEKMDGQLQQSIEAVLGTMITGRDIEFKQRLDAACSHWFTDKTRADKKDSPLVTLKTQLDAAQLDLQRVEGQCRDSETDLVAYQTACNQQPELQASLADAEREHTQLQQAAEALRERRHQSELAKQHHVQAQEKAAAASELLRRLQELLQQRQTIQQQLDACTAQCKATEERQKSAEQSCSAASDALPIAQAVYKSHIAGQVELDARQQLITLTEQDRQLTETLQKLTDLGARQQELEKQLGAAPALEERQIAALRGNRTEAEKVRARLDAEGLRLTFRADVAVNVEISVDNDATQAHALAAQAEHVCPIRQHAELRVPGIGTVTIARAAAKLDLDEAARQLTELDQAYRDALASAQADPLDPNVLDELTRRRLQHDQWINELKQLRTNSQKTAPAGATALAREQAAKRQAIELLLKQHPTMAAWAPNQDELTELRERHRSVGENLQRSVDQAEKDWREAEKVLNQSKEDAQKAKRDEIAQQVALESLRLQIASLPSEAELIRVADESAATVAAAHQRVLATGLTADELQIEQKVPIAKQAIDKRRERLHQNQKTIAELKGKLAGTEGLHARRIQAEQTVNELARALTREQLHAGAHRHLRELFERIRQEQVHRTVGPVSDRVLTWARHLGIGEYRELDFRPDGLPQGLKRQAAATDEDPVDLHRESYGRMEQLSLLIRLALGGLLAKEESAVAIFDDPLAHTDADKHRRFLDVLRQAALGDPAANPPAGPLQIIILTCHPDRFDHLPEATHIDLAKCIT